MWNLVPGNPICHKKNTIEAQKKHLLNLITVKPAVDNKPPKKFMRSYLNNKYENQRNIAIFKDNQILLNKMMKIEKTETEINPKFLKRHKTTLKSLQDTVRNREIVRIDHENQDLLKRLKSALSDYRKELWEKNHKCILNYRRNLMSGTKKNSQYDYSELAGGYNSSTNLYASNLHEPKFYSKTHGNTNNDFYPKKLNKSVKIEEDSTTRPYTAPKALYSGLPYIV